jgi:WD40 repeat protein
MSEGKALEGKRADAAGVAGAASAAAAAAATSVKNSSGQTQTGAAPAGATAAVATSSGARFALELEHAKGFSCDLAGALLAHPDGRRFVTAAGACVVIGELEDPHKQRFLRGHAERLTCLALSPSGRLIASGEGGDDSDIVVWDFEKGTELYRLQEHNGGIASVAFSHCGRFLASVGCPPHSRLIVWDMQSGYIVGCADAKDVVQVRWGGRAKDIKGRPTTRFVLATACGTTNQHVELWTLDPATGALECEPLNAGRRARSYTCVAFSRSGDQLFVGSQSGDVSVFTVRGRVLSAAINVGCGAVCSLSVTAKGEALVGSADGTVCCYAARGPGAEWADVARCRVEGAVLSLTLSTDGLEVLAGTAAGHVLRLRTNNLQSTLVSTNTCAAVTSLAFSSFAQHCDRFATTSADGLVRVWDLADYAETLRVSLGSGARPEAVLLLRDCLVVGLADGFIRAFGPVKAEPLWLIPSAHKDGVQCLRASSDGRLLVSGGGGGEIRVWELRTRQLVATLKEHLQPVTGMALSRDGRRLFSCSRDRTFCLWDLPAAKLLVTHRNRVGAMHGVALAVDDSLVYTVGQDRSLAAWEPGRAPPVLLVDGAHGAEATAVCVSPDGALIATGGADQTVRLWAARDLKPAAAALGHSAPVSALAFTADGKQLVSVGADGCVFVWNVYAV